MVQRAITIISSLLDAAACVLVASTYFMPASDRGAAVEYAPALIIIAIYLANGAPALVLAAMDRARNDALILALTFPAVLSLFFLV